MAKTKITQREAVFYQMMLRHREDKKNGQEFGYINVFDFMGEVYCRELGLWGFVSHECSARASKLYSENVDRLTGFQLFERKLVYGRSGAKWYAYRLNPHATKKNVISDDLKRFRSRVKANEIKHDQDTTKT